MEFLDIIWAYIMVFILASLPFLEVIGIIPLAAFGGLQIIPVAILAFFGNLVTVLLVILFTDKIKEWRRTRKQRKLEDEQYISEAEGISSEDGAAEVHSVEVNQELEGKRSQRAKNIWNQYGMPGLAIVAPFFIGSHITAFMAVSLGATRKSASFWMAISLLIWSVIAALLSYLGFDLFMGRTSEDGFITRLFITD